MAVSATLVVVVGVISARDHVARRRAIRETWGSHDTSAMRVTFVLGCDSTDCVERYDEATSELTVTHREAYSRVVDKFFAFVRFAMARWSFSFLCKADDDSFFVVPDFLNVLRTEAPARRHYRGNIWTGSPVRAAEHKNRLAPTCYPLAQLPPFAWGGCWLVSSDVAAVLGALASPSLAALDGGIWQRDCRGNVEDVQLGLLMLALGVVPTHDSRFAPAIRCHRRSLVLLDVPDSAALTRTLWAQCAAAPNASASAARCCTRALHTANARELERALASAGVPTTNSGVPKVFAIEASAADDISHDLTALALTRLRLRDFPRSRDALALAADVAAAAGADTAPPLENLALVEARLRAACSGAPAAREAWLDDMSRLCDEPALLDLERVVDNAIWRAQQRISVTAGSRVSDTEVAHFHEYVAII